MGLAWWTAGAAGLLLAGAAAACPTKDDLAGGIAMSFDGASGSVFTQDADGALVEAEKDGDTTYHYISANGILETGYYETTVGEDGKQYDETYAYSFDAGAIFPLDAGKTASGEQTATGPDLETPAVVPFRYVVNAEETVSVGECTYRIVPVDTFYYNDDGIFVVVLGHMPELGVTVLMADYDLGSAPNVYKITEISAAE